MAERTDTVELLRLWHGGDEKALDSLLQRELPWVRDQVHRRLGPLLRRRGETQDFVQDAMVEVLRYGPRFVLSDSGQLRALIARIVENVLRDEHERQTAKKRDVGREQPLPSDSVIDLDAGARAATTPSQAAAGNEWQSLIRLALEFLAPQDREILLLRQWQELPFETIAMRLSISPKAAHMRFTRALPRLVATVKRLKDGRLADLLREDGASKDGGEPAP
jgi:RNA polymerase sigma-70 factor (ECF subfamily)